MLCNGDNQTEKVNRVKQCIDYLYINLEKYCLGDRDVCALSPDELIREVQALNGNMEFSDNVRDTIFYSSTVRTANIVSFVHLLYHALKQDPSLNGNLSGLTFKCEGKDLSFENALFNMVIILIRYNFDILKNNEYIGTFKFDLDVKTEIATLEQLEGETVVRKYTYNLKSGEINTLTD